MSKGFFSCPNGIMSTVVMSEGAVFNSYGAFAVGQGATFIPSDQHISNNSIYRPNKTSWVGEVPKLSAASALLNSQLFQSQNGTSPSSSSSPRGGGNVLANGGGSSGSGLSGGFSRISNYTQVIGAPQPSSGTGSPTSMGSSNLGENGNSFYNLSPRNSSNSLSSYNMSPQSLLTGSSILGGLSTNLSRETLNHSGSSEIFNDAPGSPYASHSNSLLDDRHAGIGSLHSSLSASAFPYQMDGNDQESEKLSLKIGLPISESPTSSVTSSITTGGNNTPMPSSGGDEDEITLLERRLEIARIEQRLAELKINAKKGSGNGSSNISGVSTPSGSTNTEY
jgi:hypothetical protein